MVAISATAARIAVRRPNVRAVGRGPPRRPGYRLRTHRSGSPIPSPNEGPRSECPGRQGRCSAMCGSFPVWDHRQAARSSMRSEVVLTTARLETYLAARRCTSARASTVTLVPGRSDQDGVRSASDAINVGRGGRDLRSPARRGPGGCLSGGARPAAASPGTRPSPRPGPRGEQRLEACALVAEALVERTAPASR